MKLAATVIPGFGEFDATHLCSPAFRSTDLLSGPLWINVADPRILITRAVLLAALTSGSTVVELGDPGVGCPIREPGETVDDWTGRASRSLTGWTVTIKGANQTVIYRLGEYLPDSDCLPPEYYKPDAYVAEWPD